MTAIQPQTEVRRNTSIDHATSMIQLVGVYCTVDCASYDQRPLNQLPTPRALEDSEGLLGSLPPILPQGPPDKSPMVWNPLFSEGIRVMSWPVKMTVQGYQKSHPGP